jgi:hypothetical protein
VLLSPLTYMPLIRYKYALLFTHARALTIASISRVTVTYTKSTSELLSEQVAHRAA